ncbi:hypothetical protein YN1_1390 [Nanoarchaeota archaeon]
MKKIDIRNKIDHIINNYYKIKENNTNIINYYLKEAKKDIIEKTAKDIIKGKRHGEENLSNIIKNTLYKEAKDYIDKLLQEIKTKEDFYKLFCNSRGTCIRFYISFYTLELIHKDIYEIGINRKPVSIEDIDNFIDILSNIRESGKLNISEDIYSKNPEVFYNISDNYYFPIIRRTKTLLSILPSIPDHIMKKIYEDIEKGYIIKYFASFSPYIVFREYYNNPESIIKYYKKYINEDFEIYLNSFYNKINEVGYLRIILDLDNNNLKNFDLRWNIVLNNSSENEKSYIENLRNINENILFWYRLAGKVLNKNYYKIY